MTGCWLKVVAGVPPKFHWLFDVGGTVLATGPGAAGTTAGGGASSSAGACFLAGPVVLAGAVDADAGAAGTFEAVVLAVDDDVAVRLAARDPMIPRKPPTESSAVTVRDRAATCRRREVGSTDIMGPSVGGISQSLLRAH